MKILITAFDPFGGEEINPAQEVLALLPQAIHDINIVKLVIPTVFNKSFEILKTAIDAELPDVIISLGQAGGRKAITPERVAINIDDATIADNEGNMPQDLEIVSGGDCGYFSTLPIKDIVAAIKDVGINSAVSDSAGTFVCNHLMYNTLSYIKTNNLNIKAGFIHIPYIPQQLENKPEAHPSMPLSDIVKGLTAAICVFQS